MTGLASAFYGCVMELRFAVDGERTPGKPLMAPADDEAGG